VSVQKLHISLLTEEGVAKGSYPFLPEEGVVKGSYTFSLREKAGMRG